MLSGTVGPCLAFLHFHWEQGQTDFYHYNVIRNQRIVDYGYPDCGVGSLASWTPPRLWIKKRFGVRSGDSHQYSTIGFPNPSFAEMTDRFG